MKLGLIDLGAAVAFVIALVLPPPAKSLRPLYFKEQSALELPIAEAQAAVAHDGKDGVAAARLADLLVVAHQSDWAIRIGAVTAATGSPTSWRAAVGVSAAYMDRKEIGPAYEWAVRAGQGCEAPGAACSDDDRVRLEMYVTALRSVRDSGIDVKKTSKGVNDAVERAVPLIRLGVKKP